MTDPLAPPPPSRRLKGLLALLPDAALHYPYDEDEWNAKTSRVTTPTTGTAVPSRKQQRRRLRNKARAEDVEKGAAAAFATATSATVLLSEHIRNHESDIAVIFLFDPYQPYSKTLFHKLVAVCNMKESSGGGTDPAAPSVGRIHCLAVTQSSDTAAVDALLQHSGVLRLAWTDGAFGVWRVAAGVDRCPHVTVVECGTGSRVGNGHRGGGGGSAAHEDWALHGNAAEHVRDAWLVRQTSALTALQYAGAQCTIQ